MTDRVGQQLGNYRLLRVLGRGAFAEVYLGEHQYLDILAAIKVLHVQMGPETHEQFRREAHTIAHLQHPHIVRVLEFGIEDQTPYLVMEYAPNGTLRTLHPKGTSLSLEQIVTYVKQIAPSLDYAHQHRVIHRDVKPENMLLNAQHEVVLSDFGMAVVQQTMESLSTQNPAGTPLYMAPEQIQGKPCAASDQYALAVVVYEWLCSEPPFRGSLFEVYSQHLHQPPPGLGTRMPHLPPVVEDAVLGALAKDPQQRFTSVQDFATVLEAACSATQLFVSRVLPERETPDQHASSATIPASVTVPRAGEENLSDETTQPRLMPSQRTGDEQELVPLVTPSPVAQSQTVSKQVKPSVAQRNRERLLRKVRVFWQVRFLARLWVKFLSGLFGALMITVVFGLFGLNPLSQTVPLVDLSRRYPLQAFVIGGAFTAIFIGALILSSKPEDPNNGGRTWHLSPWFFSAVISTISLSLFLTLLATVLIHPSWCPSAICHSREPITNPNGIHDSNLEVYVITTQSTAFVIPGDPAQYSESNLPESIGAVRVDEKASPFLYRVVLGVHSLQQGQFGIVLEQVNLVIRQVPPMPRPLSVWIKGQPVTFNTNPYQVVYQGQLAGRILPGTYLPSPFGGVELAPGEADQLNLQVSSRVLTALRFQVQITYRVTNESQRYTLTLPIDFEVVFSDTSNWYMYRLQSGHFVAAP